jgi:RNA polymerase sigma-70 factor (ECF subfamily)
VWVLQYAYHRSINRRNYLSLRRFYNRASLDDIAGMEATLKIPVCPPTQEMARLISEAIALLPEAQRKIVQLVFFEGLTLKDVAERNRPDVRECSPSILPWPLPFAHVPRRREQSFRCESRFVSGGPSC